MSDADQNRSVVQALYAGFAAGDLPAVLAVMDPDIEWVQAEGFPYTGTFTGPDAVVEGLFSKLVTEWEGYQAVPDSYVAEGDTVVALGRYSGRYAGTGKMFQAPFAHVWTVRDGKLVGFAQHTDTALAQRAVDPS